MRLKRTTRAGTVDVGANHFSTSMRKDIAPGFMIHSDSIPSRDRGRVTASHPFMEPRIDDFMRSGGYGTFEATNVPGLMGR